MHDTCIEAEACHAFVKLQSIRKKVNKLPEASTGVSTQC
jgi:hypothetical protein